MRIPSWLAIVLLLAQFTGVGAQSVRGRVTDEASKAPAAGTDVQLLNADGSKAVSVLADDSGRFVVKAPRSGTYRVQFGRIGYASRITPATYLSDRQTYDIEIALQPSAVQVAAVVVKIEPRVRALEQVGYYSRKRVGQGHFIERSTIDQRMGAATSDIFQGITGVRLVSRGSARGSHVMLRAGITVSIRSPRYCPATVFIDGGPVNAPGEHFDFEAVHLTDIEAIEVYKGPSEVPPQYGGAEAACGVILIWRRVG
ncbi:MAG: carboxypeptidase regulatory-like domain-containing protein [Gemmatimonadota bacterium]